MQIAPGKKPNLLYKAKRTGVFTLLFLLPLAILGCPTVTPPPQNNTGPGTGPAVAKGLNIEILGVTIPILDRRPVVEFFATDDQGNGIPLSEIGDARFILDYYEDPAPGSTARFLAYTTAIEDPDGTPGTGDEKTQAVYDSARLNGLTQAADGRFTYKFAAALPADYNASATHQLGGQLRRDAAVNDTQYPANVIFAFDPTGVKGELETRDIVNTETCNQCHTRLEAHGSRREVQLCILCHNTQTADAQSGNPVDFPQMIHAIHMGENLPSVEAGEPYQIIGFRGSVNDYSSVVFPQDIRNCQVCHSDAKQVDVFETNPTIEGCASCHNRTWFESEDTLPEGYEMHVGGQQVDNSLCALCHTPTAPGPAPIRESHLIPTKSDAAPGLAFAISDVVVTPGAKGADQATVQIHFTANTDAGPVTDITTLGTVASTIAYPVPEYETFVREQINNTSGAPDGTVVNNGDGSYAYTFAATIPADPDATFAVAMEGRIDFEFRGDQFRQGTSTNARTLFTLDGKGGLEDRRTVVLEENCAKCHDEIRMHGELRVGVDYCVMCHNPNETDEVRRPEEELPPETINFKDMIHRIHRGEELEEDYTLFGFGGNPANFNEVRFPGALQECSICHDDGTTDLPLPSEVLSTLITQDEGQTVISETLPERAACTSCHDSELSNAHAAANTAGGIESCAVCHGPNADFAVQTVHALEP
jgi:OmcA/MtrC family decaheme c-type cytochrome